MRENGLLNDRCNTLRTYCSDKQALQPRDYATPGSIAYQTYRSGTLQLAIDTGFSTKQKLGVYDYKCKSCCKNLLYRV